VKGGRTAGAQLMDSALLARFSSVRCDLNDSFDDDYLYDDHAIFNLNFF
jgi:hypothetical protein